MNPLPELSFMPRVWSDIAEGVDFVGRQPWGAADDREREIHAAFEKIRQAPLARPIIGRIPMSNIGLRMRDVLHGVREHCASAPVQPLQTGDGPIEPSPA